MSSYRNRDNGMRRNDGYSNQGYNSNRSMNRPNNQRSYQNDRYHNQGPQGGGSSQFTHKPKLEDDYRNKNIHKHKRNRGSNVLSPESEKRVQ